jgi:hypothetical protein
MRHGDMVMVTEGDTGAASVDNVSAGAQTGGRRQYIGTVYKAQDTGTGQVTVGLTTLVGDTS